VSRNWFQLLFSFSGRIGRGEFALGHLLALVCGLSFAAVGSGFRLFGFIGAILTIWMHFALSTKRLHDHAMPGWYGLVECIPVFGWLWIIVIVWLAEGDAEPNRYGPPTSGAIKAQGPSSPTKGKRKKKIKV